MTVFEEKLSRVPLPEEATQARENYLALRDRLLAAGFVEELSNETRVRFTRDEITLWLDKNGFGGTLLIKDFKQWAGCDVAAVRRLVEKTLHLLEE